ncbi:MAG: hypothetical protein K0Q59_1077 [Paenibacillus sp.]|jgi:hypothetical protein|nr:hypothetical protein [Paenibacillus sp.]
MTTNKRSFYRLELPVPLSGFLKIIGINEKKIDSKLAPALIYDIGAGGMRVHTKMNFPVNPNVLLEFRFTLFHDEHRCLATIARKSNVSETVFEYGVIFSMDDKSQQSLVQHINLLNIRLRNKIQPTSCSFCSDDEFKQFYA